MGALPRLCAVLQVLREERDQCLQGLAEEKARHPAPGTCTPGPTLGCELRPGPLGWGQVGAWSSCVLSENKLRGRAWSDPGDQSIHTQRNHVIASLWFSEFVVTARVVEPLASA